jgi:hypothetical protein
MPVAIILSAASGLNDANNNFLGQFEKALLAALPETFRQIVDEALDRDANALTPTNPILCIILAHARDARRNLLAHEDLGSFEIVAWWVHECAVAVLKHISDGQANVVAFHPRRT